jgi:galactonate dehydratase
LALLNSFKSAHVFGADAANPNALRRDLLALLPTQYDVTAGTAIALVETACWQIAAAELGLPLHRLLGGALHNQIPACAAGWEPLIGSHESLTDAARLVYTRGYRILRFDPFFEGLEPRSRTDHVRIIRSCEMIRAAVGPDVALWISFGGRFGPADAIRFAEAIHRIDPAGIFDPLSPDHSHALGFVSSRVGACLAISEPLHHICVVRQAIVEGWIALVAPEISAFGGLAETRKLAVLAESHGVGIAVRANGGVRSLDAAIQLGATFANLKFIEQPTVADEASSPNNNQLSQGSLTLIDASKNRHKA